MTSLAHEALQAIERLQARIRTLESQAPQDLAVVGAGCELPGGIRSLDTLWDALCTGRDLCRPTEARWPEQGLGGRAGLLEDPGLFDPAFFGVGRQEATWMDPQQRLLMMVSQRALEHAGLPQERLRASNTGVFVGIAGVDYLMQQDLKATHVAPAMATATAHSIAANRLSYFYDLRGPSVAVDTACSSSLVALHMAAQAIFTGDCQQALVAGVNFLGHPAVHRLFGVAGMLSPSGRCRTFDADANGFVRGEGCIAVVLKPMQAALADGDRILAVLRGSAINQDGKTHGLTAPSPLAQEAVIRAALQRARVAQEAVSYIEAHGTGTALGDPIEMEALSQCYGLGDAPCWVGSIKPQTGHLEAAAGLLGFLRAVLVLHHQQVPAQALFTKLNPHIDLSQTRLRIATRAVPLKPDVQHTAAVSSFGFGGTNCHALLSSAPAHAQAQSLAPWVLPLSAKTPQALQALAKAWEDLDDAALVQGAYTAAARRTHYKHRLAVVGESPTALRYALTQRRKRHAANDTDLGQVPPVAFLFSGQGTQRPEACRALYAQAPAFRAALQECDALMAPRLGRSLEDLLEADPQTLQDTRWAQPLVYALQVAQVAQWRAQGVTPTLCLGHSMGQVAAAWACGALSSEAGAHFAVARGELLHRLPRTSGMLATRLPPAALQEVLRTFVLEVACHNAPNSYTLSGARTACEAAFAHLTEARHPAVMLPVSHGFHSSALDPLLPGLREIAPSGGPLKLPLIDSATATLRAPGTHLTAEDWVANARQPVRFAHSLECLAKQPVGVLVEIGTQTTLLGFARQTAGLETLPSMGSGGVTREDAWTAWLRTSAAAFELGLPTDWAQLLPQQNVTDVPGHPLDLRRCWAQAQGPQQPAAVSTPTPWVQTFDC